MRFTLVLSVFVLTIVYAGMAAPTGSGRGRGPSNEQRRYKGKGHGPASKPTGPSQEVKDRMLAGCRRRTSHCKIQTDESKRTRRNVKTALMNDMQKRTRASSVDAETKAEMYLVKVHHLKKKFMRAHGLGDIEPADDGLWQKDIILTDDQIDALNKSLDNPKRHSTIPNQRLKRSSATYFEQRPDLKWKMPIHYWVSTDYNSTEQAWVDAGIQTIASYVGCLTFVRDYYQLSSGSQMQYNKPGEGCWGTSYIGHLGINPINVATGCSADVFKGRVMHETIHALGGGHEQSRTDRDYHIEILWDNIDPQSWFQYQVDDVIGTTSYGFPYDFRSVMHYEQGGFAKTDGLDTMQPLGDNSQLGGDYLTNNDVLQLRRMYCLPDSCTDSYQDCGTWAIFDYCTDAERGPWMSQFCARSCGLC